LFHFEKESAAEKRKSGGAEMTQRLTLAACIAATALLCTTATVGEIVQPRVETSTVLVAVQPFDEQEPLRINASFRIEIRPDGSCDLCAGDGRGAQ
jgi:hypothetical protein